jgi:ParB family chromosome partitioning protein
VEILIVKGVVESIESVGRWKILRIIDKDGKYAIEEKLWNRCPIQEGCEVTFEVRKGNSWQFVNKIINLQQKEKPVYKHIPLEAIDTCVFLPKRSFDIRSIALAIQHGDVDKRALVRPSCDQGFYELARGLGIFLAIQSIGEKSILAEVKALTDEGMFQQRAFEYLEWRGWNVIDEAEYYRLWMDSFNVSQAHVATMIRKKRGYVAHRVQLLALGETAKRLIREDKLTLNHGLELLRVKDEELQSMLAKRIVDERLSTRETRRLVNDALKTPKTN